MKTRTGFWILWIAVFLVQVHLWAQSGATLLATTDLDCAWILDGTPQGTLKADGSAVVPVSLGNHLIQATSADGQFAWRTVVTVTQPQQEMVEIKLKDSHLQPAVEMVQTEQPTWTDPATGLMWAGKDNGKNVTWPEAGDYCKSLTLGGYSNWRLATVDELATIYDATQAVNGWRIKGGIHVSGWVWSGDARNSLGAGRLVDFRDSKKGAVQVVYSKRALCVRRAENVPPTQGQAQKP
jgi:Protein of unknown function (DUF1566)